LPVPLVAPALCFLALTASPADAGAQAQRVALGRAEAVFDEPFDNVAAVRELRDGRVLVADPFGKTVSLVDFRRGTATAVGREGQGPNEFSLPAGLVALPGDTTLVVDPAQRRLLRVLPDGRPSGTIAMPAGGFLQVRGADAQGRIYLQGSPFGDRLEPGAKPRDTLPVIRWDPRSGKQDTLAMVQGASIKIDVSGGSNMRRVMTRPQPFSRQDAWAVAPDGRVGIARVGDYHVDWIGAKGAAVRGPAVAHAAVPVSKADRDEVIRRASDRRGAIVISRGGGPTPPEPPPPTAADFDFPEAKPPFVANGARTAPDGTLWVERSQPAGAAPLYDVFDAQGRLVRQVALPKDARLVGFGATSLYLARTDADDLQVLERYKRP
jgi:hypothetical protein